MQRSEFRNQNKIKKTLGQPAVKPKKDKRPKRVVLKRRPPPPLSLNLMSRSSSSASQSSIIVGNRSTAQRVRSNYTVSSPEEIVLKSLRLICI